MRPLEPDLRMRGDLPAREIEEDPEEPYPSGPGIEILRTPAKRAGEFSPLNQGIRGIRCPHRSLLGGFPHVPFGPVSVLRLHSAARLAQNIHQTVPGHFGQETPNVRGGSARDVPHT